MPNDLQIIDGFEGLRSEFHALNGDELTHAKRMTATMPPLEVAFAAWMRATLDWREATPSRQRAIRAVFKVCKSGSEVAESPAPTDNALGEVLNRRPDFIRRASAAFDALENARTTFQSLGAAKSFRSTASEVAAWSRAVPGLSGIKAWRFLNLLGRPIIPPESKLRRFFWRYGILEATSAQLGSWSKTADLIEKIAQITGIPLGELGDLLLWHVSSQPDRKGGNRCGVKPICETCPMKPGCVWVKFHGAKSSIREESTDDDSNSSLLSLTAIKERFDALGVEPLGDAELIALLLQSGNRESGGIKLAETLLRRFGGLRGIRTAALGEFKNVKGIGESKARQIKAALDLGRRLAENPIRSGDPIESSADVWLAYRHRYRHVPQEHLITLLLDAKNKVIESWLVSKGTVSGSPAHPREVFKRAIHQSASGIILLHNHPSGDPTPSSEDFAVTRQLSDAGRILSIRLLDHIILGHETYYSFKDEGKL